jgi:hypothetical protein
MRQLYGLSLGRAKKAGSASGSIGPSEEIPWREYLGKAVGVLGLPVESFYSMTMADFWAAFEAFMEFETIKAGGQVIEPLSREELNELMEIFPDG